MRVLLLNQFFFPDPVATGQLLTDVSRELARNHSVTVISAVCGSLSKDPAPPPEVDAIRIGNWDLGRSEVSRAVSYAAFFLRTCWQTLRVRRPDVIVTLTTPPLLCTIGSLMKWMGGGQHYIWEMDLYPDICTDLSVFRPGGLLARATALIANWSRHRADGIIVLGQDMKTRLLAHGICPDKIMVCENWADGAAITQLPFPAGPLTIHYSGNFGLAHDWETIAGAIEQLADDPRFHFIFSGTGARVSFLKQACRAVGASNVEFRPYCDRGSLSRSLAQGHIGLITQLASTVGSIVPSKLYGIMAAGRPVLYIGPPHSTPADHIESFRCGWRIDPGDVDGLVWMLEHLAQNREVIHRTGRRARDAFEANFDLPLGVARICAAIGLETAPDVDRVTTKIREALSH